MLSKLNKEFINIWKIVYFFLYFNKENEIEINSAEDLIEGRLIKRLYKEYFSIL